MTKKQILLPNNGCGVAILLLLLFLIIVVPFSVAFWLTSLVAPWWVSVPVATLASVIAWLKLVKFKD